MREGRCLLTSTSILPCFYVRFYFFRKRLLLRLGFGHATAMFLSSYPSSYAHAHVFCFLDYLPPRQNPQTDLSLQPQLQHPRTKRKRNAGSGPDYSGSSKPSFHTIITIYTDILQLLCGLSYSHSGIGLYIHFSPLIFWFGSLCYVFAFRRCFRISVHLASSDYACIPCCSLMIHDPLFTLSNVYLVHIVISLHFLTAWYHYI